MAAGDIWHTLDAEAVLDRLGVQPTGLTEREAARRLAKVGPNRLPDRRPPSALVRFGSQFTDLMVLVLLGATAVSALLGEVGDALAILAIVLMNAVLGFLQESRAETALRSLAALTAPSAHVVRDGQRRRLAAEDLVPGDLVEVEAGDRVPADLRLLEAAALEAEESVLTGESAPVVKRPGSLGDPALGPADQRNMLFMGTAVTRGRGRGVVVATGRATQMGRIAALLGEAKVEPTPLERRLTALSRILVYACLAVCAAVVVAGLLRGMDPYRMFLTGVSLGVAAIPEGLPAIVTVALALGVQRMAQRRAIVRRLPAVETLGCATVVGTDKTGTLTENRMTVREIWSGERLAAASRASSATTGHWSASERAVLTAAALASDAPWPAEASGSPGSGDPTEEALLQAAVGAGVDRRRLAHGHPRLGERPFDSEARRMTVLVAEGRHGARSVTKGAPDAVLARCTRVRVGDLDLPLTEAMRAAATAAAEEMAGRALRVLAVAERRRMTPQAPEDLWEREMTLLGLAGIMDPPRPEARAAVAACQEAGIRVVMITGDHPRTAAAIAREVGILRDAESPAGAVVTGRQLDAWSDARLDRELPAARVFARVTPRHKLRVVRALRRGGAVVAMTGDGVNDAPALKEADIGVAMGQSGTDVTREAAAMVLADDNFATIVAAIEEGRAIYDNIRKFIRYLLACNTGEVLTMFLAAVAGAPLPLLPIQILWVNLVTDGLPALALGLDPLDRSVMHRPPRPPAESILARGLLAKVVTRGTLIGLITVLTFLAALWAGDPLPRARTLAFAVLTFQQLVYVFDCRSERLPGWRLSPLSNPLLLLAVLSSAALFMLAVYVPALRPLFGTAPLGPADWAGVLGASGIVSLVDTVRPRRALRRA